MFVYSFQYFDVDGNWGNYHTIRTYTNWGFLFFTNVSLLDDGLVYKK